MPRMFEFMFAAAEKANISVLEQHRSGLFEKTRISQEVIVAAQRTNQVDHALVEADLHKKILTDIANLAVKSGNNVRTD